MIQITRLTSSSSTPSRLTLAALLSITLLPLYFLSYHYQIHHPYGNNTTTNSPKNLTPEQLFTTQWLSHPLIHPYDSAPIAAYCNYTYSHKSTPNVRGFEKNVILNLYDANGGIGNVRGNFLDFVVLAIELGVGGVVVPAMARRDEGDLSDVWGKNNANGDGKGNKMEFGEMFDEEGFVSGLERMCPGLRVYKGGEGLEGVRELDGVWKSGGRRVDEDVEGQSMERNREGLRDWVEENKGDGEGMVLVNVERTLWDFDTRSLPRGVRSNLGQLVTVAEVYRRLAATVTWRLKERFGLEIHPGDGIPKGAFYGAHLRTADDAKNAGWLDAEGMNATSQMDSYMSHAKQHGLNVIYVASGNPSDISLFQTRAASQTPPIIVTSKFDLLSEEESTIVKGMAWDQQALIDWEVLKRCSVFGGIVKSSFAFNVAVTRQQWVEDWGFVGDPWEVQEREVGVAFDDGFSRVFGRDGWHERRVPRGMWP